MHSQVNTNNKRIPKVIHYCWFGNNPKPELVLRCIESWKVHCPDYELLEWNEQNFDVAQHPFMKAAYEAKKWAFVSDVARLLVVYQYGGIYLDTDVELHMPLDIQLQYECFFAFESAAYIASGLGFGAIKEHPYIKVMIDSYQDATFNHKSTISCPQFNTEALRKACPRLERNGTTQVINNCIFTLYRITRFLQITLLQGVGSKI